MSMKNPLTPAGNFFFFCLFIYVYGTVAHSFIGHDIGELRRRYNADSGKGNRINIIPVLLMITVAPIGSITSLSPVSIEIVNICIS